MSSERSDFYVYILFREDGKTPFYVGKGTGHRVKAHSRLSENQRGKGKIKEAIARKVIAQLGHVPYEILYDGLTETEAMALEMQLIASHGRICDNSGILANMTTGGEGASGVKQSQLARQRKSESHMQPEIRRQKSERLKETFSKPEVRQKLSDAQKRIRKDPETRAKLEKIRNDSFARPEVKVKRNASVAAALQRPETKKKLSEGQKRKWSDPEFREFMSNMHKERLARKRASRFILYTCFVF